jgi:hypothetical protein
MMDYTCAPNYSQIFFMMLSFIPIAICLPCWFVATFAYKPYMDKLENSAEIPFEKKFPIEDAGNEKNSDFENCIVLSNTPQGMVYMKYSKEEEGFEYWADKAIDYKYLEAVARKYVTLFSCKDIYIERIRLLKEKIDKIKEEIEKNKEEKKEKKEKKEKSNDVFASLKSNKKVVKTKIVRSDIVCEKSNKYIKKGKIKEAAFGKKKEAEPISFLSWNIWRKDKSA